MMACALLARIERYTFQAAASKPGVSSGWSSVHGCLDQITKAGRLMGRSIGTGRTNVAAERCNRKIKQANRLRRAPSTRVSPHEYRGLPLEAHRVLRRIPLRDVYAVDLLGGGADRTLADVHRALGTVDLLRADAATTALVRLRLTVGRALRWDNVRVSRPLDVVVPPELAARSHIAPGTKEEIFTVLYVLDREEVRELVNATVHVCLASVLVPRSDGYRLLWAVHVRNVSRLTPLYMAAIEPFRRFVIYPRMLARIRKAWEREYGYVNVGPGRHMSS